jgi:gliding motility-associated-like protein
LPTPAVPTISTTAATCLASGSSTISNYAAGTTYTFTPSGPSVGATGLISGMTIGTSYTVTAGNTNCTSASSTSFVNAAQFGIPNVIVAGNLNYCNGNTTSIILSSSVFGTTFSWNIVSSNLATGVGFVTSSSGSTINQNLSLLNQNNSGTITYLVTPEVNGCYGTPVEIIVLVNPIPTMSFNVANNSICSGDSTQITLSSTNAATTYSWTIVSQNGVLGATNGSGSIIQQVLTTSNPVTIGSVTYEIIPTANGCVGLPILVTITVNPNPEIIGTLLPVTICSGETTSIVVLASLPSTQFSWRVVTSQGVIGFSNGIGNTINQVLETTTNSQGYVIYEVTPSLNGCSGQPKQYLVYVNPLPNPNIEDGNICVNQNTGITYQGYLLDSGLSSLNYSFEWYFNNTLINGAIFPSYLAQSPGLYLIKVVNTQTGCMAQDSAVVSQVFPATSISATVSEAFTENATISVIVNSAGTGHLLFQLDDGVFQDSAVFENVSPGNHTVTVIDSEGCTYLSTNVLVINYPHYFTPNGDGINDTWNIVGLQSENNASIYIFDRYGKLIKQISPFGLGWDGSYNGNIMPSTDYWFKVEYKENNQVKEFKSHFSLKR